MAKESSLRSKTLARIGPAGWMLTVWLLAMAVSLGAAREPAPRWQVTTFATPDFTQPLAVTESRDARLASTEDNPIEGSVMRWETCLQSEQAIDAAFQLTSDGSAQLFIDGTLVIDDAETHARRSRGAEVRLAEGEHEVRVDYEAPPNATGFSLVASLEDSW